MLLKNQILDTENSNNRGCNPYMRGIYPLVIFFRSSLKQANFTFLYQPESDLSHNFRRPPNKYIAVQDISPLPSAIKPQEVVC